jgi:hypothetical protein
MILLVIQNALNWYKSNSASPQPLISIMGSSAAVVSSNSWYCDMEFYQFSYSGIYLKEICILKTDLSECYNYHISWQQSYAFSVQDKQTEKVQYNLHRLPWVYGFYTLVQALNDIFKKMGENDRLFVKGVCKCDYLKRYFSNVCLLPETPSYKDLNKHEHECCETPHGIQCARRKAFELTYFADYINNGAGSTSKKTSALFKC